MPEEERMNPYIVEESQARYQERVDVAEAWRLEQMARVANIGLYNRVWAAIGERLIALGDTGQGAGDARHRQSIMGGIGMVNDLPYVALRIQTLQITPIDA
jgi:hypothetical protein